MTMKILLKIFFLLSLSILLNVSALGAELKRLGDLAPYENIAVLQKKYLPKTERFELFVGASNLMNDTFFLTAGLSARIAYHFSEQYALEGSLGFFTSENREVVGDLTDGGVETIEYVTSRQYYGLNGRWSPIYGKISYLGRKIVPYEIYFTGGGGITKTSRDYNEISANIGIGQMFAISKRWAIKWDFNYTAYNGRYINEKTLEKRSQLVNNVFLSVGVSVFFPEATYR